MKAQVSGFILIGIVIVLVGGGVYIALQQSDVPVYPPLDMRSADQVHVYLQSCIQDATETLLVDVGLQAGYLVRIEEAAALEEDGLVVPYWYYQGKVGPLTRQTVSQQLKSSIEEKVEACFGDAVFPGLGFRVKKASADITINNRNVVVQLHYPITVLKENQEFSLGDIQPTTIPLRLGLILDHAMKVVSSMDQGLDAELLVDSEVPMTVFEGQREELLLRYVDDENSIKQEPYLFLIAVKENPINHAPYFVAVPEVVTGSANEKIAIPFVAEDPDLDSLQYDIISAYGEVEDNILYVTYPEPGDYTEVLKVSDGKGGEDWATIVAEIR